MAAPLEDYGLIGDCQTVALVSRDGSVDWLCAPRFDSPAFFAGLLGTDDHGHWSLRAQGAQPVRRQYRGETLVLETEWEGPTGAATVIDFMPIRDSQMDLVRLVRGRRGRLRFDMELVLRFDYGSAVPWVRRTPHGLRAIAGPDEVTLHTPVPMHGRNLHTVAAFEVEAGDEVPFVLIWGPSHQPSPAPVIARNALEETERWWRDWVRRCCYTGPHRDAVLRSAITLKALTYAPTGGIVAAPTTSLPEALGGVRNWDYRYCWIRDATFTLDALMGAGYMDEAHAWREWLLRAVAGEPSQMRLMYGVRGERRLIETEVPWLPGYESSLPVRLGNDAYRQMQLDVYGEVMDAMHACAGAGLEHSENAWLVERALLRHLERAWEAPDHGIWEVRGPPRHFTHSKVMAWVAFDRAVHAVERFGLEGPVERWRVLRDRVHEDVCQRGFSQRRGVFVQHYETDEVDASLLMMPLVGFLPANDPRMIATVEAIERDLMIDGFVHRYISHPEVDGLPRGEASFLLCSFWLADVLALMGRRRDAEALFERLLSIRNDLGLLSEAYDVPRRRLLGNFPQAFSHVGLMNTALQFWRADSPTDQRRRP